MRKVSVDVGGVEILYLSIASTGKTDLGQAVGPNHRTSKRLYTVLKKLYPLKIARKQCEVTCNHIPLVLLRLSLASPVHPCNESTFAIFFLERSTSTSPIESL